MDPSIKQIPKKKSSINGFTKIYATIITSHPLYLMFITFFVSIFSFLIAVFLYGLWPTCNQNYYRWSGEEISQKWDSYIQTQKVTYSSLQKLYTRLFNIPKQFELTQVGCLFYENEENIINVDSFREIWKVEEKMHETIGWSDFCYKVPMNSFPSFIQNIIRKMIVMMKDHLSDLEDDTNCIAFKSVITEIKKYMRVELNFSNPTPEDLTYDIIQQFFKSTEDENSLLLTDMNINNDTLNHNLTKKRVVEERLKVTFFGTDYEDMKTKRMRSLVVFGLPLKDYKNKEDRFIKQTRELGKWQVEFLKPLYEQENNKLINPCAALPFELEYEIFDIVLGHVPYFCVVFVVLLIVSWIYFHSFFLAFFGMFGVFLSLPVSVALLNLIAGIHHFDVIYAMAIFMYCIICGYFNFVIYNIFMNNNDDLLLTIQKTNKKAFVGLFINSFSSLSLLYSGSRLIQYFGVFAFFLLMNYYFIIYGWFIPSLSFYASSGFYKVSSVSIDSLTTHSAMYSNYYSTDSTNSIDDNNDGSNHIKNDNSYQSFMNNNQIKEIINDTNKNDAVIQDMNFPHKITINYDYPRQKLFDFILNKVQVDLNICMKTPFNFIERIVACYIWPFVYFYRFIFYILFASLLLLFGYFVLKIDTRNEIQFLKKTHRIQRALNLAKDGFSNPLNDNAFVFVWGLNSQPKLSLQNKKVVNDYGIPTFHEIDVTNHKVQKHIMYAWDLILNQSFIDFKQTETFGYNPWGEWSKITSINLSLIDFVFDGLNITKIPDDPTNISKEQYNLYNILWQLILSLTTLQEPDNYIPGTLKGNTVGFSFDNYSLQFIGMKANMFLTKTNSRKELKELYSKAKSIENQINEEAVRKGIPEFQGWMTSAAWIDFSVEENIFKNITIIFFISLIPILLGSIFFVSFANSIIILITLILTLLFTLGTLKLTNNWAIGLNEGLMISFFNSYICIFIEISYFDFFSEINLCNILQVSSKFHRHSNNDDVNTNDISNIDNKNKRKAKNMKSFINIIHYIKRKHQSSNQNHRFFPRIQEILMDISCPMLLALITLLLGSPVLLFCPYQMFPPFVPFMCISGFWANVLTFILLPILLSFFS
ncbi:hypothetical protein TRFO_20706 [Tritrichomonas foetus]|uniref:SSD domain-containing protein n=1 Tax=Tritrichomonas foetus TaxID=1144522 RepID=A0A1J4KGM3_9EUKA|nr:hypothetical protein TRFO_20706 [Tritrichomonas foetus]|eukprot:OHT10088.1 hypothetical protein TRFO_20706 [Tritrichomonas foetus]